MQTTASIIVAAFLATLATANPIVVRQNQVCNQAPAANPATVPQPLERPTAATATACQEKCNANPSCQSFAFGLPAGAGAPTCILFSVPASGVPSQGTNINIFDKACAASSVPTQAPTEQNPIGLRADGQQGERKITRQEPKPAPAKGDAPPPPPPTPVPAPPAPEAKKNNRRGGAAAGAAAGGAAQGNENQGNAAAPAASPVAGQANNGQAQGQAQDQNQGNAGQNNAAPAAGQNNNAGQNNGNNNNNAGSANRVCGAAPTGPATSAPTPFRTDAAITSQADCLTLCKANTQCQSCEFGQPSAGAANECRLFTVPAAQLPAPASGLTRVAFDAGC